MVIDWTQIFVAVIMTVGAILGGLVTKQLVPWLKEKKLYEAAVVAVNAAEAIYGRYGGDAKLEAAIQYMIDKGIHVDREQMILALKAAWKDLDIRMIEAGVKDVKETEGNIL